MGRNNVKNARASISAECLDPVSDEEVIARVLGGEKELYEIVMRRYNQRMFRISRSYLHDADEAEETVQQAYIIAYEHLAAFEGRSQFSTWLTRIVINEALRRQREMQRVVSIDDDPAIRKSVEATMRTCGSGNPAETVLNEELRSILERTVDALPPMYRTVFVMREIEEMSIAETSESLGITQTNVKVRLSRAKEMLRQSIDSAYQTAGVYHFDLVRCDRIVAHVLTRIQGTGEDGP